MQSDRTAEEEAGSQAEGQGRQQGQGARQGRAAAREKGRSSQGRLYIRDPVDKVRPPTRALLAWAHPSPLFRMKEIHKLLHDSYVQNRKIKTCATFPRTLVLH